MLKYEIYQKHVFPYGQSGLMGFDSYEVKPTDTERIEKTRAYDADDRYFVRPLNLESQIALIEPDVLFKTLHGRNPENKTEWLESENYRIEGVVRKLQDRCVDLVDEVEDLKIDLCQAESEKEILEDKVEDLVAENDDLKAEVEGVADQAHEDMVEYLSNCTDADFNRFVGEIAVKRAQS